jgi:hypothetical protein
MQPHSGNEDRFVVVKSSGDDGVEGSLAGDPQRVGWFRFYFDDDRWEWSPQVEKMHGYQPGSVTPTTEMVLAHKHPDDYRHIADTLELIANPVRCSAAGTASSTCRAESITLSLSGIFCARSTGL